VTDKAGLERLLGDLANQREVAVDTEADSFYCYREKVCLLQISVEDRDYVVDPLSEVDLRALGPLFADPSKLKVFHDGEYDISILKRDYDFRFSNLFDTRVAAAALGMQAPGLAAVLLERFGVELDKSMQRSNWATRPLTSRQITYARLDTHYLIPLMNELRTELAERGRTMILEGECKRLERLDPQRAVFDPDEFVTLKGARALSPRDRRVLRELFVLRDRLAEAQDSPPFRVMNNQLLVELARARPGSIAKLSQMKGFGPRLARKIGTSVLETIARAQTMEPLDRLPRLPRRDGTEDFDDANYELHERLKRWRKNISESQGIEAAYLLNRHALVRIAKDRPETLVELEKTDGLLPWQLEMFGKELLALVERFEADLASGAVLSGPRTRRRRGSWGQPG
jgi:ribonuclease D